MPDSHSFATAPTHRPNVRERGAPRDPLPLGDEPDNDEFDPSTHTIDEVKAYVTAHADYAPDIMEAEQDGKGRVTLLEWLDNFGES